MVCGDFENFQISPVCGVSGVWCVETLKIFKISLCVESVVCGDFENFQGSPACRVCGVWCMETLEILQRLFFSVRSLVPLCWRDCFFTKNPCAGDFSKTPLLEEIDFFGKFPYRENNFPVCGPCVVVCGDFEIFQNPPVLWCVGTLSFSKFPCVWALCCGVWGL